LALVQLGSYWPGSESYVSLLRHLSIFGPAREENNFGRVCLYYY